MVRAAVIAAALLMASQPAGAQQWQGDKMWSGGWLTQVCGSRNGEDELICFGFLAGYQAGAQAEAIVRTAGTETQMVTFCKPVAVDSAQMARVLATYGRSHPENHHYDAATFAALAFRSVWPCR